MDNKRLITAAEALAAWEAGEVLTAHQVEAKPERQNLVWSAAFELLGKFETKAELGTHRELLDDLEGDFAAVGLAFAGLSDREREVAHSIAYVVLETGWSRAISLGTHAHSPAIQIQKEKAQSA